MLHIRFENVQCYYINLIDLKYSISSLKAFVQRVATIHKKPNNYHTNSVPFNKWTSTPFSLLLGSCIKGQTMPPHYNLISHFFVFQAI